MPVQRPPIAPPRQKTSHVEIVWKTVTYRTVMMYVLLLLAVLIGVSYLIFPEVFSAVMSKVSAAIGAHTVPTAELTAKQAKFVNDIVSGYREQLSAHRRGIVGREYENPELGGIDLSL